MNILILIKDSYILYIIKYVIHDTVMVNEQWR